MGPEARRRLARYAETKDPGDAIGLADALLRDWKPGSPAGLPRDADGRAAPLVSLKNNITQLYTGEHLILFSYATPVAFMVRATGEVFRSENPPTQTSNRHIGGWINTLKAKGYADKPAKRLPQSAIESILTQ